MSPSCQDLTHRKAVESAACNYAGRRRQQGTSIDEAAELDPSSAGGIWDGGHAGLASEGVSSCTPEQFLVAVTAYYCAGHIPHDIAPVASQALDFMCSTVALQSKLLAEKLCAVLRLRSGYIPVCIPLFGYGLFELPYVTDSAPWRWRTAPRQAAATSAGTWGHAAGAPRPFSVARPSSAARRPEAPDAQALRYAPAHLAPRPSSGNPADSSVDQSIQLLT